MAIATKKNAVSIQGEVIAHAPILKLVNTELSAEFGKGSGSTVDVLVPSYGVVTEGEAVGDATVSIESIPVVLNVINTAANLGIVEKSLAIDNYDEQVARPRGSKLAAYINGKVFGTGLYAAESAVVSTGTFAQLGTAVANVERSRIDGDISGVLDTQMKAIITNSGISQFGNSNLGSDLYKGVVGEFNGAEFISTPDALIVSTAWVPTSGTTVSTTVSADEAYQITLADAGLTSANTIKAGTQFQVADVYNVDMFGNSLATLRSFIVIEDKVASAGSVQVKVAPLYFSGARKNCSANITAGKAVTTGLTANSNYYTGIVFGKNSIAFASAPIKPFAGCDSSTTTTAGEINIRMSVQGTIATGVEQARWDTLVGQKAVHGKAICALYVKA